MITPPPITYTPHLLDTARANDAFTELWTNLNWIRFDKVPRREYYTALNGAPYTYGKPEYARTYPSQPLTPMLQEMWGRVENFTGVPFDVCFLNGYEDASDYLGWHSDDSPEMDDNRPIAILSLGAERDIEFRPKPTVGNMASLLLNRKESITTVRLGHGSLCLMAQWMQDTHQHRIPKVGRITGPRISLTFRGWVRP